MGDRQIQISTGNLTLAATLNELEIANQLWESPVSYTHLTLPTICSV